MYWNETSLFLQLNNYEETSWWIRYKINTCEECTKIDGGGCKDHSYNHFKFSVFDEQDTIVWDGTLLNSYRLEYYAV